MELCVHNTDFLKYYFSFYSLSAQSNINFHVDCLATCLLIMFAMWGVGTTVRTPSAPPLRHQDWSRDCDVWQLGGRPVSSHSLIMMLVGRRHLSVFLISSRTLGCLVNKPTISLHPTRFFNILIWPIIFNWPGERMMEFNNLNWDHKPDQSLNVILFVEREKLIETVINKNF